MKYASVPNLKLPIGLKVISVRPPVCTATTYRLEAIVSGERLQPDGTIVDMSQLQAVVQAVVADLHYRDLGTVEGLRDINTTAEHVAYYCWRRIAAALSGAGLTTLTVRI
jgi:6-pyruvoyltetrahydropterin/6-carboxytetrahydropterin synthase